MPVANQREVLLMRSLGRTAAGESSSGSPSESSRELCMSAPLTRDTARTQIKTLKPYILLPWAVSAFKCPLVSRLEVPQIEGFKIHVNTLFPNWHSFGAK